ncbi:MAG: MFS transporter [Phaeodactylibacter sp.]|nr:MFS transporter [Phaeodactylibacter sp.]MCB9274126.1 MFS transporter [Lewinellaceae bacterium]
MAPTKYRYRILALLFIATAINYMDRSIIGVLGPTLQYKVFYWSDVDYANINIAFKVAYAIGMLAMGAMIDRLGSKKGYTISIAIWSLFGMLHAAIRPAFGLLGFIVARFGLGFGEAGNFPAALKTVAEWFPKKDRAFAAGIFNAGSNIGAILAPLLIPLVVLADGTRWQLAFLMTGMFSLVWIGLWLSSYNKPELHAKVNAEELAYIHSDGNEPVQEEKVPWRKVLPLRETWAFAIGKLSDAAWWFYLFWSGKFLYDQFGLDIKRLALPLIVIYLVADLGSIIGGWLSRYFIHKGWTANKARKVAMLICASCILPVMFTARVKTDFRADARFLSAVASESYQGGPMPEEIMQKLEALEGGAYHNARAFIGALDGALGKETASELETVLLNHARPDNRYWLAVLLIALAAGGHQAWSANLLTIPSDVFPKKAVASVVGIGGMLGAVAGLIADFSLGQVLQSSGPSAYFFAFLIAGLMYLIILAAIHLLMPGMIPLDSQLKKVR